MKKLATLLTLVLSACSMTERGADHNGQTGSVQTPISNYAPTYASAVILYKEARYGEALSIIDKFIATKPHSLRFKESLYLKGKIFKQLNMADECLETMGKVTEISKALKDSFFAYSLYYSGLCYEIKNETSRAIAVYQDASKARDIPDELKNLEIPARLAIAYSRIGEDGVSKKYYDKTKVELSKLKKSRLRIAEQRELLSEILMNMGTLTQAFGKNEDFENYLDSIKLSQEYLVLVFQLDMGAQSDRALKLLVNHFEGASLFIQNLPHEESEDSVIAERTRQELQKKLANVLLENIENFETYLTPESQSKDPNVKVQLHRISNTKIELEKVLAEKPIGQGLTAEAIDLLNPRVKAKMRDKKTVLEEKATLPKKRKETKEE